MGEPVLVETGGTEFYVEVTEQTGVSAVGGGRLGAAE